MKIEVFFPNEPGFFNYLEGKILKRTLYFSKEGKYEGGINGEYTEHRYEVIFKPIDENNLYRLRHYVFFWSSNGNVFQHYFTYWE